MPACLKCFSRTVYCKSSKAYAFPISVKSKPTLVENHGCQTCIALNHDWSLHNSDLCIGSLLFVAVTYGLYQGLVELVNVINGGLVLLGVVQQRMMGQVDPRNAGTPGVPKLGPSWLFSFVPSDLNSTMLPWWHQTLGWVHKVSNTNRVNQV